MRSLTKRRWVFARIQLCPENVVDLQMLRSPQDNRSYWTGEYQVDSHTQRLRPVFDRTKRRGGPVVFPDERTYLVPAPGPHRSLDAVYRQALCHKKTPSR